MKTRIEKLLDSKSRYCYENGVLINKLGITDKKELDKIEASLTYLRLCKLAKERYTFRFDPDYYLELHKYIFQDIYDFAGDIRDENIYKVHSFCSPQYIYEYLKKQLSDFRNDIKNIKTLDDYIEKLSYYYSEINLVHPFREGNGRTQREYFRQLVEFLNDYLPLPAMYLDYSSITEVDRNNLIQGCINGAVSYDLTLLKQFFKAILKEKNMDMNNEKQFR